MSSDKIVLLGGGGHCKSVLDVLETSGTYFDIVILDRLERVNQKVLGRVITGTDDDLPMLKQQGFNKAFVTLSGIGMYKERVRLITQLETLGYIFPNIIATSALVSDQCQLGKGNFVGKGAIINADVTLGDHAIINSGAIVEHDCIINDYVHVGPGSVLSGAVQVGYGTHVGTNSTVIQNIKIGSETIIGAGSVLVRDIESHVVAYGVPCREMRPL